MPQCTALAPDGSRCQCDVVDENDEGLCQNLHCIRLRTNGFNAFFPAGVPAKPVQWHEGWAIMYGSMVVLEHERYPSPDDPPQLDPELSRPVDPSAAWRQLMIAAKAGNVDGIIAACDHGALWAAHETNVPQATALHFAAARDCVGGLKRLLAARREAMAPLNECQCISTALAGPINWAAAVGAAACVELLMEDDPKDYGFDDIGGTALFYASLNGHENVVDLLAGRWGMEVIGDAEGNGIQDGKWYIDYRVEEQNNPFTGTKLRELSPLSAAASRGHSKTVYCLLKHGARIDGGRGLNNFQGCIRHGCGRAVDPTACAGECLDHPELVALNAGHVSLAAYLAAVRQAGGFTRFLAGPRLRLAALRALVVSGRAVRRQPDDDDPHMSRVLAFVLHEVPTEVFALVAKHWWRGSPEEVWTPSMGVDLFGGSGAQAECGSHMLRAPPFG